MNIEDKEVKKKLKPILNQNNNHIISSLKNKSPKKLVKISEAESLLSKPSYAIAISKKQSEYTNINTNESHFTFDNPKVLSKISYERIKQNASGNYNSSLPNIMRKGTRASVELRDNNNSALLNNLNLNPQKFGIVTKEEIEERELLNSLGISDLNIKNFKTNINLKIFNSKMINNENASEALSTDPSFNATSNLYNRAFKHKALERLDNKIENEHYKLKVLSSENNIQMLDQFLFKGQKSKLFNSNKFDIEFRRTDYSNNFAFSKFFTKYNKHRELIRKNVIKTETPSFAFIREAKSLNKVPFPLGLIKKQGNDDEINLNNHGTGDDYVNIIAKSIIKSEMDHVKNLNLSQNRITLKGLDRMLYSIRLNKRTVKSIRRLNLSNNHLSSKAGELISNYIRESDCSLKELILENTGLNDGSIITINDAIIASIADYFCGFNYGKNNLTDKCMASICEVIEYCETALKSIQLQNNNFSNVSAAELIKAISRNSVVKFLDISHNKLGDNIENSPNIEETYKSGDPLRINFRNLELRDTLYNKKFKFSDIQLPSNQEGGKKPKGNVKKAEKPDYYKCLQYQSKIKSPEIKISPFTHSLGDMFGNTKSTLYHLDISYNNLNYIDCLHIQETVKENHTILGIHVDGNEMEIDELGFITAIEPGKKDVNYHASYQIHYESELKKQSYINKYNNTMIGNPFNKSNIFGLRSIRNKNNCWICDCWRETVFTFNLDELKLVDSSAAMLHNNNSNRYFNTNNPLATTTDNDSPTNKRNVQDNLILKSEAPSSNSLNIKQINNEQNKNSNNNNTNTNNERLSEMNDLVSKTNASFKENTIKASEPEEPIYKVHLNFEDYKGYEMNVKLKENKVIIHRMCPAGQLNFFFTYNDKVIEYSDDDVSVEYLTRPIYLKLQEDEVVTEEAKKDFNVNTYYNGSMTKLSKNDSKSKFNTTNNSVKNTNLQTTYNNASTVNNFRKSQKMTSNLSVNKTKDKDRSSSTKSIQNFNSLVANNTNKLILANNKNSSFYYMTKNKRAREVEGYFPAESKYLEVNRVVSKEIIPNSNNVDHIWINHLHYCFPRPMKQEEMIERPRTPWSFPMSIWSRQFYYEYEGEPEEAYFQAFEHDFNRCNFNKDLRNNTEQLNELKWIIWEKYKKILLTYKYVSSFSGLSIWQIPQSTLLELMNKATGIYENYSKDFLLLKVETVKMADLEEKKKKNKNVPDNLVRHSFLNFLIKLAVDKYITNLKTFKNPIDAVSYSFENHYNNLLKDFPDPQEWRKQRYYNEQVDNFIQAHIPLFNALYKTWATKKETGKKDKTMTFDDFFSYVSALVDKDCPVRDIPLFYNQAIKIQENEIDYDRHYLINFPEFIEATCKIIDKAVPKEIPLIEKLENYKNSFQKLISSAQEYKNIKEKFILPKKDPDLDLYEYDIYSPFYIGVLFPPEKELKEYRSNYKQSSKNLENFTFSSLNLLKSNLNLTGFSSNLNIAKSESEDSNLNMDNREMKNTGFKKNKMLTIRENENLDEDFDDNSNLDDDL